MINIPEKTQTKIEKKRWLSPTSINSFIRCPRKFYYSKIAKIKQKSSIHLIRGIAVHNAIEKFYKLNLHRCSNMDYSDLRRTVIDLLKDEWRNQAKQLYDLQLKKDEIELFFQESCRMILNFLHNFLKDGGFEQPTPIIEKTIFSEKLKLLGRIDAIYKNKSPPLIIDFKTCKTMEVSEEYKRQLAIYTLLYKEQFHQHPTTGIHFLKFKDGLKLFNVSAQRLAETKKMVSDIHNRTQSNNISDYPCVCGWCDKNFDKKNVSNR